MALSNIIERIDAQAEEEAQSIVAQARERAEQTRLKAQAEADAFLEEATKKQRADAKEHQRRLVTLASLDLRKRLGDARQSALEDAFRLALEHIQNMQDDEYAALLKTLIISASETGREQILLSAADKERIGEGFLTEVNDALKRMGKKGDMRLSEQTRELHGGAILIGNNVELNCAYDSTLKLIRDDIESEVASLLFGGALHK